MGLQNGEKKGILLYYNYLDEMEALSDTQKINILFVLAELDLKGKIETQRERFEDLQSDSTAYTLFKIYLNQQNRASRAWHNINQSRHAERYDNGKYLVPTSVEELIEQATATKKPPAEEPPAEEENRGVEGIVMSVDTEKGLLILDSEEVFRFDTEFFGAELKDKVGYGISLFVNSENVIEDFGID